MKELILDKLFVPIALFILTLINCQNENMELLKKDKEIRNVCFSTNVFFIICYVIIGLIVYFA